MKKITVLALWLITISKISNAQINVVREDFATPNEWYRYGYDTTVSDVTSLLQGGANKIWDVRGLFKTHYTDTSFFVNGMTYPTAPAGCNLVEYTIDPETGERNETFYAINNNELRIIFDGSGELPVPGAIRIMRFPSTYLTNFKDSIKNELVTLAEDLGLPTNPLFDSAKISVRINLTANVDGWGKLQFTNNTFDVLRQKNVIDIIIKIQIRNRITGQYSAIPGFPDQSEQLINYIWFGKNSGSAYLQIATDTDGNINETKFMLGSSRGVVNSINKLNLLSNAKIWPNPANNILNVSFSLNQQSLADITIFDVNGKVMQTLNKNLTSGENSIEIPVSELPNGLYFYQIKGDNINHSGKFLKD